MHDGGLLSRDDVTRGEWLLLAAVTLAAAWFRCQSPGGLAVAHFDEGVYASNLAAGGPDFAYPMRHLYAPPLWPNVLETWQTVLPGVSPVWPGVIAGVLSVPLMWWAARSWYGPAGGLLAAALLAMSDTHVLFSRTALTDVPMSLLMLAGVYAAWRATLSRSAAWTVAAGVLAGLAWSAKYNGWLTLAVSGSATAAWWWFERAKPEVAALKPLRRWAVVAAVGVAAWLPALWSVQSAGGYGEVSDNHAQYFVGPAGWWDAAVTQVRLSQAAAASGTWWPLVLLAGFGALAVRPLGSSAAYFLASVLGTRLALVTWLVPVVGTAARSLRNMRAKADTPQPRRLATWMTLAWVGGLFVAVPLYTPYLRLTVPLVLAGCLAWADLATRGERSDLTKRSHVLAGLGLLLAAAAVKQAGLAGEGGRGFLDRSGVAAASADVATAVTGAYDRRTAGAGLYVFGEPAFFYHLSELANDEGAKFLPTPAANMGVLDRRSTDRRLDPFVVVGPHGLERFAGLEQDERLEEVARWTVPPDIVSRLDAEANADSSDAEVVLYRVR